MLTGMPNFQEPGAPVKAGLFSRGQPIKGFVDAWRNACTAAGLPGMLLHDFRRTAVRNLERGWCTAFDSQATDRPQVEQRVRAVRDQRSHDVLQEFEAKLEQFHKNDNSTKTAQVPFKSVNEQK
jgi:hypothetical protein